MYPHSILGEFGKINGHEIITLYGVCIAIGVVLCIIALRKLGRVINVDSRFIDFTEMNGYVAIIFGFLFSALFQGLYNYIENPSAGFSLTGGITFIGGLIGGVVSFVGIYLIFKYKTKKGLPGRITDILPLVPCCITIAHAFGRVGCFFAGCCYGKATDSWIGLTFHKDSPVYSHNIYPQKVIPTNLIEAIFLLLIFGVMTYLLVKKKFKYNFVVYLATYGIFRFVIEFFRGDDRGQFIGTALSPSQTLSILMIVATIPLFFGLRKLYQMRDKELSAMKLETANENIENNNSDESKENNSSEQ